ncbi:hypothetical protein BGZ88_011562 [Linnemannia elongata]|nr:hypothetical protein BGZ88_011562 [Linnemannia elongata]
MSAPTNSSIEPFEVNTHSDSSNKNNKDTDTIKTQTQISLPIPSASRHRDLSPALPSPVLDTEMLLSSPRLLRRHTEL